MNSRESEVCFLSSTLSYKSFFFNNWWVSKSLLSPSKNDSSMN